MHAKNIDHMFHFKYMKNAEEIRHRMRAKVTAVKAKVEERQGRIADLRASYDIDDAALVQLLTQARKNAQATHFSYSTKMSGTVRTGTSNDGLADERTIGAGVVNNLLTENDFVEAELDQVRRMETIVRNLRPVPRYADGDGSRLEEQMFELTYEELEFLGF